MPVVTRNESKNESSNYTYCELSFNKKNNAAEAYVSEVEKERRKKVKIELLKSKHTVFVIAISDICGLKLDTMKIFKNFITAKEYEESIKDKNDYIEYSIVTNSGEFIRLLKKEVDKFLQKEI